ncbi:reverse transcriptase domain-containing protein [Tanacetum coccineum]|uniref:Reverse transcriptase domain-containing protein n=1 Tax=Tanacetum coccineum TaxID=301880 RepID=A0ABQ5ILB8_9ASTR
MGSSTSSCAARCPLKRRSLTGYFVMIGQSPVSWRIKKQHTVFRSSTEAEYRSMATTIRKLKWLKGLLHSFGVVHSRPMKLLCDSQASIPIAANPLEGGGGGRGVKEKQQGSANDNVKDTVNVVVVDDPVLSSLGGLTVEKVINSGNHTDTHDGNVGKHSIPTSSVAPPNEGNAPINVTESPSTAPISAPISFAKLVTGEPSRKSVNFSTLITPARNMDDMAVHWSLLELSMNVSSMDGLDSMLENGPWFIRNNQLILKNWNPDVNLLIEDVVNVSVWVKLHGVHVTAFSVDGLSAIVTKLGTPLIIDSCASDMCACCKVFSHVQDECPKKIGSDVAKNLKNPSQAPRGVPVGPKLGFKPVKQVYRPVSKKNNINTSCNKKKDVESRKEVSNPNLFEVLNSVENDVDLGTNGRTSNLASKEANSSGSSFWNVGSSSDHDSEDEVEPVKMASFLASKRVGYGINSLLEQWTKTYENADYNNDLYDDDMYEDKEIPDNIQSICDMLDIKLRGRKKKYII